MEIDIKEFVKMVRKEIKALKFNATKRELNKLNFDEFDHTSKFNCIYGQMTGHCRSKRAKELTPKIFAAKATFYLHFREVDVRDGLWFTALEHYLFWANDKTKKNIIDYLQGRKQRLFLDNLE